MEGLLIAPGDGERVTDSRERFVAIKAGREEVAVTESRYLAGESGPGRHVHREHVDCFWVLAGELTFELGRGEEERAGSGTWVLVPPGVVHTFRNEGPGEARFLDYLRRRRDARDDAEREEAEERFDTFDPPEDGGRPATDALMRRPGGGENLSLGATSAVIKSGRHEAGGLLALTETTLAPSFPGPVPHRHQAMTDSFYVLEGRLAVRLGD